MPDETDKEAARTEARTEHSWWPGWIWAVPIAVLLVVGWLGIRALTSGGEDVTIAFSDAHGLNPNNTKVIYRGMQVGSVTGLSLAKDGRTVEVSASIQSGATQFLRSGTRFWLKGANPSLDDLSSLSSVLSGPGIVMDPGAGKKTTRFAGLAHQPIAPAGSPSRQFEIAFDGDAGALKPGDPVKLRGFDVGEIKEVHFKVDAASGAISTPVVIALYPALLHIDGQPSQAGSAIGTAVEALIQNGLRARLDRDPPLIGGYRVTLDMVPGAPEAMLANNGGLPQIPVAPGGGLDALLTRLNKVPIDQIAQNVLDVTKHADDATKQLDHLVSSSKLKESVAELDASLKDAHKVISGVETVVSDAGPKITNLITDLRGTAAKLDQVASSANKIVGNASTQTDLKSAVKEITEAARGVRDLADYLDRHPEALIKGRG